MFKTEKFTNQTIADQLRKIAAVYEIIDANKFRVSAYRRAADSVEHASSNLKDIWDDGQLNQLSGIGKNIAKHLDEFFKTGHVKHFQKLEKRVSPAVFIFLEVPGIGPKTAYKLSQNLKIRSQKNALKRLQEAGEKGRIRTMIDFGEKSEKEIIASLKRMAKKTKQENRMLLRSADQISRKIINYLKKSPMALAVYPLGSLRRQATTIGDIDIAVKTKQPQQIINYFVKYPEAERVLEKGKAKLARILLKNNCQIDLRTQAPESFGAMLQYFTGSKHHNIHLRELALKKGLSLSEYGIKNIKTGQIKKFAKEEEFYQYLGLKWIPPELRENTGEIKASQNKKLPHLVKEKDIKGDLHLHSNFDIETSHDIGDRSFIAMVKKAEELSYQYLAFTEHNPSQKGHTQKEIITLLKRKKALIDEINCSEKKRQEKRVKKLFKGKLIEKERAIFVFNSLEIDIKPNGQLALPPEAFSYLDFAIAGIHSQFHLSKQAMTIRILKALHHPKVKILAHPMGRLLNRREGYEVDWPKIFSFCQQNNKILEINCSPKRLDLPDYLVREAIENNVKLVINTDTHHQPQMEFMKYGLAVARRGWAEKKDIINTLPLDKIKKILLN